MRTLEIQTLLRLHGLDHVVEYLKLVVKEEGDLVLLKYKQIEADWSIRALHDCRGIILDRTNGWSVVAFPYEKFFNLGEGYCAEIDWDTAKIFEKKDGSLINLYFYNGEWRVQSSGMIYADGGANNNISTLAELFWKSAEIMYGSKEAFLEKLDTNNNYMFELCTPENIVVTPHQDYSIFLHGIRDMRTFNFINIEESNLITVKLWDLKTVDEMLATLHNMDWKDEGFVVCDANYNRGKCKNPKYIAIHHISTGVSPYSIMNVIKTNEIDEFCAYFKHREEEVFFLKDAWDNMEKLLTLFYRSVEHIEDQEKFAKNVLDGRLKKIYTGMMFSMRNNKIESIHEGMCKIQNSYWYNLFKDDE